MKKIADIFRTAAGGTPLKSNKAFYEGGDIPWLLSGEVGGNITKTKNFITQAGLDGSSAKIFPVNTVLIAMYGATAGEVGILRCEAATNQAVCGIYPNENISPEYLYYFFLNHKDQLVAQAVGNAQPNISQQKIKDTEIDLPCISVQKRLVAILDEAFADIEQVRAKTEQNLKNARELFESYLQQVFSQCGEGWVEEKLVNCFKLRSGDGLTAKDMIEGSYPVYGGNGIAGMHNNFNLSEESIIIGRVGALCGNARHITEKIWLTDNAFKVVQFQHEFDYVFLTYLLNFKNLRSLARQAAQPVISNSSLSDLMLAFPSNLSEQKQIALKINKLEKQVTHLESTYSDKLKQLDELKKSILQKAFSGELTQKNNQGAVA